jgi:hypothetical protein
MVVDSNVGFNKTNAVVETKLSYDVDLTNLQSPTASLTVFHKNNSADIGPCKQWNKVRAKGEKDYPITDCYWDYLRVYILPDTYLLDATVQTVPAAWMILNRTIPPQVDVLDEGIDGVRSFGTLKVVPGGQSRRTNFRLALPSRILETRKPSPFPLRRPSKDKLFWPRLRLGSTLKSRLLFSFRKSGQNPKSIN